MATRRAIFASLLASRGVRPLTLALRDRFVRYVMLVEGFNSVESFGQAGVSQVQAKARLVNEVAALRTLGDLVSYDVRYNQGRVNESVTLERVILDPIGEGLGYRLLFGPRARARLLLLFIDSPKFDAAVASLRKLPPRGQGYTYGAALIAGARFLDGVVPRKEPSILKPNTRPILPTQYVFPLSMPCYVAKDGDFLSPNYAIPILGKLRRLAHPAADFNKSAGDTDAGAAVYAVCPGVVTYVSRTLPGWEGGVVKVAGDDGRTYGYYHVDPTVRTGQRLKVRDQLAKISFLASASSSHLHVEITPAPRAAGFWGYTNLPRAEQDAYVRKFWLDPVAFLIQKGAVDPVTGSKVFSGARNPNSNRYFSILVTGDDS